MGLSRIAVSHAIRGAIAFVGIILVALVVIITASSVWRNRLHIRGVRPSAAMAPKDASIVDHSMPGANEVAAANAVPINSEWYRTSFRLRRVAARAPKHRQLKVFDRVDKVREPEWARDTSVATEHPVAENDGVPGANTSMAHSARMKQTQGGASPGSDSAAAMHARRSISITVESMYFALGVYNVAAPRSPKQCGRGGNFARQRGS